MKRTIKSKKIREESYKCQNAQISIKPSFLHHDSHAHPCYTFRQYQAHHPSHHVFLPLYPPASARQTKFQPYMSLHWVHLNDAPVPDSPESCTCIDTPAQDTQHAAQTTASRDPSAGHVRSADKMSGSDQPCAPQPSPYPRISCRSGGHPRSLGRRHSGVVVSRSWGS